MDNRDTSLVYSCSVLWEYDSEKVERHFKFTTTLNVMALILALVAVFASSREPTVSILCAGISIALSVVMAICMIRFDPMSGTIKEEYYAPTTEE